MVGQGRYLGCGYQKLTGDFEALQRENQELRRNYEALAQQMKLNEGLAKMQKKKLADNNEALLRENQKLADANSRMSEDLKEEETHHSKEVSVDDMRDRIQKVFTEPLKTWALKYFDIDKSNMEHLCNTYPEIWSDA